MMTTTRTGGDGALAPSPITPTGHVIPAKAGTYRMPAQPHNDRHSRLRGNDAPIGTYPLPPNNDISPLRRPPLSHKLSL